MKDHFINYLRGRRETLCASLELYDKAVREKDEIEIAYKDACDKVRAFGNMDATVAERDDVESMIAELEQHDGDCFQQKEIVEVREEAAENEAAKTEAEAGVLIANPESIFAVNI